MPEQQPMTQDERNFIEEWCYVWGKYKRTYYSGLTDEQLEKHYGKLMTDKSNEITNGRPQ